MYALITCFSTVMFLSELLSTLLQAILIDPLSVIEKRVMVLKAEPFE